MKEYRFNYMSTFLLQVCCVFLSLFPGNFLILLFLSPGESVLSIFPFYIIIILLFLAVGTAIHFIISLFTKPHVFIDKKTIRIESKAQNRSMPFEDVAFVTFDFGRIAKFSGESCSVTLLDCDCKKSLSIHNPSFRLILQIIRNCPTAKYEYENYKLFFLFGSIWTAFAILLCVFVGLQ